MKTKTMKTIGTVCTAALALAALILAVFGCVTLFAAPEDLSFLCTETFFRQLDEEDFEDEAVCRLIYENEDGSCTLSRDLPYDEWEAMDDGDIEITGFVYTNADGSVLLAFPNEATDADIASAFRDRNADKASPLFAVSMAIGLFAVALFIVVFFGKFFTLYEKCWFLSILVLAAVFSLLFPEESCNGVSGILIMALYLADTLFNILCELLISKQSKWNFLVSLLVEICEIAICLVLSYRFATMATTLFFWIPCDIVSFINWNRKTDKDDEQLTRVRTLTGWQEIVIIGGIVIWTAGVGYLLTLIDFGTELFGGNEALLIAVCYLDACASAVGVFNGVAILLRLREQWIAWYLCAALESVINILSGQYVLLVLKAGYFTNTTYGYIKWSRYIKDHPEVLGEKTLL